MEYPEALYTNGRPTRPKEDILEHNYMYQRHKPGIDWNEDEGLPDYTKIKIDPKNPHGNQSYNWDELSKPHWARFNPNKEYQSEYAVVGYLTETIRNLNQYYEDIPGSALDVEHEPVDLNYSHCQLSCPPTQEFKATRAVRREMRKALKNKAKVFLKPHEE